MKKCKVCHISKPIQEFYKTGRNSLYYRNECKTCAIKSVKKYSQTKKGLAKIIFDRQKSRTKIKNLPVIGYNKTEFIKWILSQQKFHQLFEQWKKSNYKRELSVSCDRLNDYLEYSFQNIQIITWRENNKKGHFDRLAGINNKASKKVKQKTLDKEYIKEYYSAAQASRETKIAQGNISRACRTNTKAGNFYWEYS